MTTPTPEEFEAKLRETRALPGEVALSLVIIDKGPDQSEDGRVYDAHFQHRMPPLAILIVLEQLSAQILYNLTDDEQSSYMDRGPEE